MRVELEVNRDKIIKSMSVEFNANFFTSLGIVHFQDKNSHLPNFNFSVIPLYQNPP